MFADFPVKEALKLARKAKKIYVSFPGAGGTGGLQVVKADYIWGLKQMDKDATLENEPVLHTNGNLYL